MCVNKKNNNLTVVLEIRTSVLQLVIDPLHGTVRLFAPEDPWEVPSVGYRVSGKCCA